MGPRKLLRLQRCPTAPCCVFCSVMLLSALRFRLPPKAESPSHVACCLSPLPLSMQMRRIPSPLLLTPSWPHPPISPPGQLLVFSIPSKIVHQSRHQVVWLMFPSFSAHHRFALHATSLGAYCAASPLTLWCQAIEPMLGCGIGDSQKA